MSSDHDRQEEPEGLPEEEEGAPWPFVSREQMGRVGRIVLGLGATLTWVASDPCPVRGCRYRAGVHPLCLMHWALVPEGVRLLIESYQTLKMAQHERLAVGLASVGIAQEAYALEPQDLRRRIARAQRGFTPKVINEVEGAFRRLREEVT